MVDLLGSSHAAAPEVCTRASGLRILDVAQPLAYCLPGVRSRVVVSQGALKALADGEIAAILSHERAHLRARHDLVLEMFTAVHAAFPRFVRSARRLDAVRFLIEMLADDAAVRVAGPTPLARAWSPARPDTPLLVRLLRVVRPPCCGCAASADGRTAASLRRPPTSPRPPCSSCPPSPWQCPGSRTSSTAHRIIISAVKAAVPQQKTKGCPNEFVCKL